MARYAVVLAAGRGERLWPLTSTRPKPLVPLPGGDSTLLGRVLRQVRSLVDGVLLVAPPEPFTGMVREEVLRHVPGAQVVVQEEPRGTGDAARVGVEALPRGAAEVLLVYGDLFLGRGLIEAVAAAGAPAVAGVESSEPWNYGVLSVSNGCLMGVREKPRDAPPGSLVNAGVYLLPRRMLEEALQGLSPSPRGEFELTDALARLASATCVRVVSGGWSWLDVGRPWDLFTAYRYVFREQVGDRVVVEGEVEPGAVLRGPVYVARGAVVRGLSLVEGPAWIEGEVSGLARLRPWSFLLRGSKAGSHVEVKASILLPGAKAPHLNYVGDSILGENVNLGAGTVTANLRFDHGTVKARLKGRLVDTGRKKLGAVIGDHAQTGVNVSTLPGSRIGAYSWVYPGLVVKGDVPDCSLARPAPGGGLEVRPLRGGCPPWLEGASR